jgi:hypothetical protein
MNENHREVKEEIYVFQQLLYIEYPIQALESLVHKVLMLIFHEGEKNLQNDMQSTFDTKSN